ncbi:MAG: hypothetical protein FWE41_02085 [Coriobacteriia bacterium]|nr:hypothetical protein [Coriobacteriia bacterium]MCL2749470.1 hypothetical protein [Coriobacteriia bacterium]
MFQFDLGQIGTLTPSPCSRPWSNWNTNPVPLFHWSEPGPQDRNKQLRPLSESLSPVSCNSTEVLRVL